MISRRIRATVVATLVPVLLAVAAVPLGAQMRAGLWLDVFVQGEDGTPVTDLSRGDFVVQQGGAIGRILDAELVEWPLRVVLLVEESSRLARYLTHLRNGLPQLVDGLPEGSEVAVVLFASRPRTLVETTTDLAAVRESFGEYFARRGANANLFQAFRETVPCAHTQYPGGNASGRHRARVQRADRRSGRGDQQPQCCGCAEADRVGSGDCGARSGTTGPVPRHLSAAG
jgi:hypothetical protein